MIGGLLDFHHHGNTHELTSDPRDLALHRLAYIGISNYLVKLLRLVPTSMVSPVMLVWGGARCSSVVTALAHGAMGRRINPSWGDGPIELFLVPASAPRLV